MPSEVSTPGRRPGEGHDHSWAEDMGEVRACCPDYNPGLAGTGIRCPGGPAVTLAEARKAAEDAYAARDAGQAEYDATDKAHARLVITCRGDEEALSRSFGTVTAAVRKLGEAEDRAAAAWDAYVAIADPDRTSA